MNGSKFQRKSKFWPTINLMREQLKQNKIIFLASQKEKKSVHYKAISLTNNIYVHNK